MLILASFPPHSAPATQETLKPDWIFLPKLAMQL